jgi:hypothetical protein
MKPPERIVGNSYLGIGSGLPVSHPGVMAVTPSPFALIHYQPTYGTIRERSMPITDNSSPPGLILLFSNATAHDSSVRFRSDIHVAYAF